LLQNGTATGAAGAMNEVLIFAAEPDHGIALRAPLNDHDQATTHVARWIPRNIE
jgi:hypothetical protein